MKKNIVKTKNDSGQALLILVLILGATMLGVTTIAGYISMQKIKTGTDIMNSMKSIYAADYGLECSFYKMAKDDTIDCSSLNLSNGTTAQTSTSSDGLFLEIKSIGKSGDSSRAFGAYFQQ